MAKRLESAQTAVKAVSLVTGVLNELNWVCNPLIEDFGIDLHVKVFEPDGKRRALPWEFYVQVKGTTTLHRDGDVILFNIDTPHLRDWSESRLPVLFVVCDVLAAVGFWLEVNEYLDKLDADWDERGSLTLRIPERNRLTPEGLLVFLRNIRRTSLIHEAPAVIAFMETPSEQTVYDQHFWPPPANACRHPLAHADAQIHDLALARCTICMNYFWIDESLTVGHDRFDAAQEGMPENLDFTQIYGPRAHEPAVYSCDSPEEFCPFCMTGHGALLRCGRCEKYNVPGIQDLFDWNDPLVTKEEAEECCAECLDAIRAERLRIK